MRCQRTFPNTFNITAVTFADIAGSNTSNTSSTYLEQSEKYGSTVSIKHTLVHRLSEAVGAVLIISVVLNFFFIPLRFLVNPSNPGSSVALALVTFVFLDLFGQCAAVGMVYVIFREEVARVYHTAPEIHSTKWPVKFEVGFWLLVGAAASRFLGFLLSTPAVRSANQQTRPQNESIAPWQPDRSAELKNLRSLRDIDNVDERFYSDLTLKIANTTARLRIAVNSYWKKEEIDDNCMMLLNTNNDHELSRRIVGHFNQHSAPFFLGMQTGGPPGPLLYQHCPKRGPVFQTQSRNPGVYLVILSKCRHGYEPPSNVSEYMYVGSSNSLMHRVQNHTSLQYRNEYRSSSKLYEVWENLATPCVSIYLLAEGDKSHPFSELLLTEAIWQVALQTFVADRMFDFVRFLQGQGSSLVSGVWEGCNIKSAVEKPWQDNNTLR